MTPPTPSEVLMDDVKHTILRIEKLRAMGKDNGTVTLTDKEYNDLLTAMRAGQPEGIGLTVHEADVIAAAVQLSPLLEEGWDEYDCPQDKNDGEKACEALIKAVNAMLAASSGGKG